MKPDINEKRIYLVIEDDGERRYPVTAFANKENAYDYANKLNNEKEETWYSYYIDEYTVRDM